MPRDKKKNPDVTKRLQTELQSLVAYGCYDSNAVLKKGTSAKRIDIIKILLNNYMPHKNSDHLSQVELLLEGKGKYAHLFHRDDRGIDGEKSVSSTNQSILTIPEFFHCLIGKDIAVKRDVIDLFLMTRKNMTNCCNVTGETLYRHAKDVEANCKKALALCLEESSPYRNFNGTFPSGTNWEDYLLWIRQ